MAKFCSYCGTALPEAAAFCSRCGKQVMNAQAPQQAYGAPQQQAYVMPPQQDEVLLAQSGCQFAKGAGIFASRGNALITNRRIVYFKHGIAKTLLLGHAVHLTKGDYDMEIQYSDIGSMYWNTQGLSRYIGLRTKNGEHHRIYFIQFDSCLSAIQQAVPYMPIPKG